MQALEGSVDGQEVIQVTQGTLRAAQGWFWKIPCTKVPLSSHTEPEHPEFPPKALMGGINSSSLNLLSCELAVAMQKSPGWWDEARIGAALQCHQMAVDALTSQPSHQPPVGSVLIMGLNNFMNIVLM